MKVYFLYRLYLLISSYVCLQVGKVGASSENISQRVEFVQGSEKRSLLLDVLEAHMAKASESQGTVSSRILVFAEKKRDVDILEQFLYSQGFKATSIHGDRTQAERERALLQFRQGVTPILLATAVASRGLDIPNVHQVVIYDFPADIDEYVHRIGRTGRAGNLGSSIAFFTQENANLAKDLLSILKEANQVIPKWLLSMTTSHHHSRPSSSNGLSKGASRYPPSTGGFARQPSASTMNRDIRTPSWSSTNSSASAMRSSWSASPAPVTSSASYNTQPPSRPAPSNYLNPNAATSQNSSSKVASNWEDLDSSSNLRDSWY